MGAIFRRTAPECIETKRQAHRRHRHKKFHVAPEALGVGYEAYRSDERTSPPPSPVPPPSALIREVQTVEANAPGLTMTKVTSEWAKLSEKEATSRAARNALQLWFWLIASLILIGCIMAYRGWGWRLVEWMYQFPAPTR